MMLRILKEKAIFQGTPLLSDLGAACLHSTAPSQAKWRNKWSSEVHGSTDPLKKYGKYEKRILRAEANKALKRLQNMKMPPRKSFQAGMPKWNAWRKQNQQTWSNESYWKNSTNQANSKGKNRHNARTNHSARTAERVYKRKRKSNHPQFCWDSDDPDERIFEMRFGGRSFYWSFSDWDDLKWQSTWRSTWQYNRTHREEYSDSDVSDDVTPPTGSASDRKTLGLAPHGPLKLEDVKQAFRECALKWHPDRNPGPSKVIAEEKFKRCGAAYKALCDAFSVV
uniref:J domain-containing protein n=1 Tax=Araucaria cunninghamii TaxID=56994 RepID=A0A0D6R4G7_ARACU